MEIRSRHHDEGSPAAQVRIARSTDLLAEVVRFYRDALGLEQIASFEKDPNPTPISANF